MTTDALGESDYRRVLHVTPEVERDAVETALRASEARFQAVWEATSEAVALSDPEGIVLAVNPAYCKLYGREPADYVGQSFALIFPEADRAAAIEQYRAVFASSAPLNGYEARVQRPDGSERIVEARADFLVQDGERVAMISTIRDITERKRLEQVQQDFVAMASHDLLGPVTVLRARAQLMRRRGTYDEAALDSILEQTSRMERMIADLRGLVQVESGQLALRPTAVDLGTLVQNAVERVRIQATGHRVRLKEAEHPIVGQWDADRLGQVLDNLLGNAVKYAPAGSEIQVLIEKGCHEANVIVADQGPGIPPAMLPHLFDRFYRGEHARDGGLGLGLYISRMLVEAHGGRISATSEPGVGSAFTVTLPLEPTPRSG